MSPSHQGWERVPAPSLRFRIWKLPPFQAQAGDLRAVPGGSDVWAGRSSFQMGQLEHCQSNPSLPAQADACPQACLLWPWLQGGTRVQSQCWMRDDGPGSPQWTLLCNQSTLGQLSAITNTVTLNLLSPGLRECWRSVCMFSLHLFRHEWLVLPNVVFYHSQGYCSFLRSTPFLHRTLHWALGLTNK